MPRRILPAMSVLLTALALAGCAGGGAPSGGTGGDNAFGHYRQVETFEAGDAIVSAFVYDALVGPYGRLYSFCVSTLSEVPYVVSLGSYDDTTAIARELGEIPANGRLYHLDDIHGGGEGLIGMFVRKPGYDEVREMVARIAAGQPSGAPPPDLQMTLAHMLVVAVAAEAGRGEYESLCT